MTLTVRGTTAKVLNVEERDAVAVPMLAIIVGAVAWAAFYASIELGRTTPWSVSMKWALTFLAAAVFALCPPALALVVLRRVGWRPAPAAFRASAWVSPMLLSVPLLAWIYLSDSAFHFLTYNAVPRALAIWVVPAITLVSLEVLLVWATSNGRYALRLLLSTYAVPILIFFAFASLYVFTSGAHLYSPDEKEMYEVTASVVHGSLATTHREGVSRVEDGNRLWSQYGLVPSLIAVPPYVVSQWMGIRPDPPSSAFPTPNPSFPLVDLLVNPLFTAATCSVLFCMGLRLGFGSRISLLLVLAYGIGTSAWVYSKTFFGQPVATFFLVAATHLLTREDRPRIRSYAFAGLMLGLGIGTRFELPLIALPLAAFVFRGIRRDPRAWLVRVLVLGIVLVAVTLLTAGWYNWVKSGSLIGTGYAEQTRGTDFGLKPYIGLFGTFFSSGFGLITFNPISLLGLFSLTILAATRKAEAWVFATMISSAAVFYSVFNYWYGGYTWANRYMLLVLPFAVLPAGILLKRPWRSSMAAVAVVSSIVLGVGINLLAVLFDWNLGWMELWTHNPSLFQIEFDPHFSTIGAHLRLLREFLADGTKLDLYVFYKLGVGGLVLFVGGATLFATLATKAAVLREQHSSSGKQLVDSSPELRRGMAD